MDSELYNNLKFLKTYEGNNPFKIILVGDVTDLAL